MSTHDNADRILDLLRNREHAEQAISILESLDDPAVARLVVVALRNPTSSEVWELWRGGRHQARALIACGDALHALGGNSARIRMTGAQLALPGIEHMLRDCRELTVLDRANTAFDELIMLPPLPQVESIRLQGVHVDLRALATSPRLRTLAVRSRQVADTFVSLHPAARLHGLLLHEAPHLTSLDGLETQVDLEQLEITAAPLADLAPLRSLAKLRILDLRHCSFPTLEPLTRLHSLRVLSLDGTGVSPADVPDSIRPYATWSPQPALETLAKRPVHPDAAVV